MPWTSTDTDPVPDLGAWQDTQPVPIPAIGPGDGPGLGEGSGPDVGSETTNDTSTIPSIGAIGPVAVATANLVGATLDDLQLSALWRPRRYLFAVNQSAARRGLAWLGLVTITYAGTVTAALTVGPDLHGGAAFILVALGVGLVLVNIVGVFVLATMGDSRPTSRAYMEGHLVAHRLAAEPRDQMAGPNRDDGPGAT